MPDLKLSRFVMDLCGARVRLGLAFVRPRAFGVAGLLRPAMRRPLMRSCADLPFNRALSSCLAFAELIGLVHTFRVPALPVRNQQLPGS